MAKRVKDLEAEERLVGDVANAETTPQCGADDPVWTRTESRVKRVPLSYDGPQPHVPVQPLSTVSHT